MSTPQNLLTGPPGNAKKAREFAGWKIRIRYATQNGFHIDTEARFAQCDVDPVFQVDSIRKVGPNGGEIRYVRGEFKTIEKQPDGTEVEIPSDSIKYIQDVDGLPVEVEPFDAVKTWDIQEDRQMDECTIDGPVALGTAIPLDKAEQFGPDKESGSKLYGIWGDDTTALRALAERLEKEKLGLYYPHVFRKGLTIHLAVARPVRFDGTLYLVFKTFAGPVVYTKPLAGTGKHLEPPKPILAKPVLKKKSNTGPN